MQDVYKRQFDISVNAAEWKQDGEAFEVYVRYVDADNYFKLTYTPSNGTFTLFKCVGGVAVSYTHLRKFSLFTYKQLNLFFYNFFCGKSCFFHTLFVYKVRKSKGGIYEHS